MNIAGYCRISVDEELNGDNISIENQKLMIRDFVQRKFPDANLTFFEDRDRSGYTFEQREGYQKLRRELRAGNYPILIVKDFSRFSRRNSLGLYELEVLRDEGIRIISIGDHVDYPTDDDWLSIQFRFLMNELPVTDTSKKVRAVIQARQAKGEWICNAPYGYYLHPIRKGEICVDEESAPLTLTSPFPAACETDMNDYWRKTCQVLTALTARNADRLPKLRGICTVAQGDGCWPIDQAGNPVRSAILWNDTRSKELDIFDNEAVAKLANERLTNGVLAGSVTAILKWLQVNEPAQFEKTAWALHCKDWLNYRLCGALCTDVTDASTALMDVLHSCYVPEELDALGLSACAEKLPPIVESTAIIGRVSAKAAAETGLPEGLPVAEGALDVCATAIGSDLLGHNTACSVIGTTLANQMVLSRETAAARRAKVLLVRHVIPDTYINILSTLSGTSSLDYVKELFCPDAAWSAVEQMISQVPIGCDGLVFHPYLRGERAPFTNPFATGGFFGINPNHTRAHYLRSAFEGIVCSFYDCFMAFPNPPEKTYLAGGAAQNECLAQMFADMLGKPCYRVKMAEQGTLGAVRILQVALGEKPDFFQFDPLETDVFVPDAAKRDAYLGVYERFYALRKAMTPLFHG